MNKTNKILISFLAFLMILTVVVIIFLFKGKIGIIKDIKIPFFNNEKAEIQNSNILDTSSKKSEPTNDKYENIKIEVSSSTPDIASSTLENNLHASSTDSMETSTTTVKDMNINALVDSDDDGLYDYEEIEIYKTDYLYPDTDEDGFGDGEEVAAGFNPLGEGYLATDTAVFILKEIETARHECQGALYKNKINYLSQDDSRIENMQGYADEFNQEMEAWLWTEIPNNDLLNIVVINREEIDQDTVKMFYKLFYDIRENDYAFSENKELYFVNIDGQWMVDTYLNMFRDISLEEEEKNLLQKQIVADVKKIQSALSLYYLEQGVYPDNIYPDIATGTTVYLSTPLNQSTFIVCPEKEQYSYRLESTKDNYTLEYCLEKEIDSIPVGINIAQANVISMRQIYDIDYKDCGFVDDLASTTDFNVSASSSDDLVVENEIATSSMDNLVTDEGQEGATTSLEMYNRDTDNDGLLDIDELIYKTDPNNPDTDGDGYLDGDEIKNGYNPLGEGLLI